MYTSNTFYALLIGISKYRNPSMPDLPATINDVRALAEVLTDPYYCCYLNENVRALLNEQATSTGIRMALQQVAQTVTIESTVLIYFSGHGGLTNESNDQKVYLCSQETDPDDLEHTAISGVEFDLLLAAIPARKLLIILDACHASGAAKIRLTNNAALWREGLSDNYMQELAQGSGRVVIASSKEDQLSWNRSRNDHGLFSWYLLEGLKGEAAHKDEFVHVLDLYDYVNRKVKSEHVDQEPVLHAKDVDNNFPIALSRISTTMKTLSKQMKDWFEALKYEFEQHEVHGNNYFEWIIKVPIGRRRYKYVLVRGIEGQIGLKDVNTLRQAVDDQDVDEGWLVTTRQVSQIARDAVKDSNLFCYTFDELLDEDADFDGYLDWLEAEIKRQGIDKMYIPLACSKEEYDPDTKERIGVSTYDESNGWIDGYINRWLTDSTKEHISILGEFGTGKTWFALHYAWNALQRYREAKAAGIERPRLPLVISLRDYAKALSIEFLFSDFFFRKHEIPLRDYSAFEQLNRMGKLLLIFDGFDEMADKVDRQKMINNFWELARVVVPGSKVILTCRTEHFPEAREGRALLNAELQAATLNLTGTPPQFEILALNHFNDDQIRQALSLRADHSTVERVMSNRELIDLARRPLMTELILEALPEIKRDKPIDLARVYLYAVRQKMERDIRDERTFTSLADKLYFLCELSWEMLSTDRMSLNYRLFPDRIRQLFGPMVQEQKDLDHWYYDMMGQTMLIPDADGDYAPAHRSLLEFFVAYKLIAELGVLALDFTEVAGVQSHIDMTTEAQNYTWSSYFRRDKGEDGRIKRIPPLSEFIMESMDRLSATLGKLPLTKAILDFMNNMLLPDEVELKNRLLLIIAGTRGKTVEDVGITAGNIATLITYHNPLALKGCDLSKSNLSKADFCSQFRGMNRYPFEPVDLSNTILVEANLQNADFSDAILVKANLSRTLLHGAQGLPSFGGHDFYENVAIAPNNSFVVAGGIEGKAKLWNLENGRARVVAQNMSWIGEVAVSSDGTLIAVGDNTGHIVVYDVRSLQVILRIHDHEDAIAGLAFDSGRNCLITASGGNPPKDNSIRVYTIPEGNLIWHYKHKEAFRQIAYCSAYNGLFTLDWRGGIDLWEVEKRLHIKNLRPQAEEEHEDVNQIDCIGISADFRHVLIVSDSAVKYELQVLEFPSLRIVWERNNFPLYFTPPESPLPPHVVPRGWNHAYTLSHNAHLVAFSVDACLILWDVLKDKELWHSNEHFYLIESINFSQDDKYIITGARDATIKIWDVESGKSIRTISTCKKYHGLRLTGASGLDSDSLRGLKERGAII